METRITTGLEQVLRTRQLQLWSEITKQYEIPIETRAKIHSWIISGRLSDKAKCWEPKSVVQHDNKPSSLHHS